MVKNKKRIFKVEKKIKNKKLINKKEKNKYKIVKEENKKKKIEKNKNKNKDKKNKIIFFDNNSTTKLCESAKNILKNFIDPPNISSSYKEAIEIKNMVENSRIFILNHCKTNLENYKCIFNSGASEGNNFIIRSVTESYYATKKIKPHVLVSAIEHKSIIDCLEILKELDKIEYNLLDVNIFGQVEPETLIRNIKKNTCLVCIMFANNELGTIMPIKKLFEECEKRNIFFHCDAVQIFGKYIIDLNNLKLHSLVFSFHKLYGPKQCGCLIIRNDYLEKYKLHAQIAGSQEYHLRSGTENAGLILSGVEALKNTFENRELKNKYLLEMRNYILDELKNKFKIYDYNDFYQNDNYSFHNSLIILSCPKEFTSTYLPNTILLSYYYEVSNKELQKNDDNYFCNINLKNDLENKNFIISIGSACNTSSKYASHVLKAINAKKEIKRGTIRISLGDTNNLSECKKFCEAFFECIEKQKNILDKLKNERLKYLQKKNEEKNENEKDEKKNIKKEIEKENIEKENIEKENVEKNENENEREERIKKNRRKWAIINSMKFKKY